MKVLKIFLGILIVGLALLAWQISSSAVKTTPTIQPKSLTVEVESNAWLLGKKWKIQLDKNKNQFTITNTQNNKTVLQNTANIAFLTAAAAEETVNEYRGSFYFKDKITTVWNQQSITQITHQDAILTITGNLSNSKTSEPYSLTLSDNNQQTLALDILVPNKAITRTQLSLKAPTNEQITGFGTQFSHYNIKGKEIPVFVSEQGLGKGDQPLTTLVNLMAKSGGSWYTSYSAVPFFMSSEQYGLALKNYEYSLFDFKQTQQTRIICWSNQLHATLFSQDSQLDIINDYTASIGRMTGLPSWTQDGIILGFQGGTEAVLKKYQTLKKAGAEITAVWIQDWVGQRTSSFGKQLWWNWELDPKRYKNWEQFKQTLHQDNVKILGYINPFLVDVSERKTQGRNLFIEARDLGYLVTNDQGEPVLIKNTSFSSGILDLSNPACQQWIKIVIKENMIDIGLDGWMADFGEALPYDVHLHDANAKAYHNQYPEVWAQLNREAIQEAGKEGEVFFFSRSGFTNSPSTTTAFWLGDQMVNWGTHDGLKSAVTGLITAGVSGMSINHSDIGGYTTIVRWPLNITRSEELMIRWAELNVFSALYRSHEGNMPDANVQLYNNERATEAAAYFSQLFSRMKPYRALLMSEYQKTGKPMVLHPSLLEPSNAAFSDYTYQGFFFGSDVYVSPVVEAGVLKQQVDLPSGNWMHVWSGQQFEGGKAVDVSAPVGQPPVFVRVGTEVSLLFTEFVGENGLLFERS